MSKTLTPEAERILQAFRQRGLHAGQFIAFTDFCDVIEWKDGFVKDDAVREALATLFKEEYLVELNAGLELGEGGERYLYSNEMPKHGARVYSLGGRLLIKQTVLRGTPPEYVVDEQRERHVGANDDHAIATAIRDAVSGRL